jgi:hypothetical protein
MQQSLSLLLAFCGFMTAANAQLVVKINDKVVAEGQTVDAASIEKMEVSFSNLKKPKAYSLGKVVLSLEMKGKKQGGAEYRIVKTGENAIDAFVSEPQSFVLYEKDGANDVFYENTSYNSRGKGLVNVLKRQSEIVDFTKLTAQVSIYFKDKVGYEKYGDAVDLAKPFNFKINNGVNADGSIPLRMAGLKMSAANIVENGVEEQGVISHKLKLATPVTTNNKTLEVVLENETVYMNEVDCKGKTQDETLASMKKQFDEFLFFTSNICSGARSKLPKMTDETENAWLQFLRNDQISCLFPALNKEENKSWDKETPMKPVTVGKLTGFKFASIYRLASCKSKLAERPFKGRASIYILKHPTDTKKVLLIFSAKDPSTETEEKAKDAHERVEKFVAALEF